MRFDGSDVSSLGAIALGSLVGLVGTGLLIERFDDAQDVRTEQRIEVRAVRTHPTTTELLLARGSMRLRPRLPRADIRNGPVIFVDGVRIDAIATPDGVLDDLDPDDIQSIEVRKNPDDPRPGEIRIELKH